MIDRTAKFILSVLLLSLNLMFGGTTGKLAGTIKSALDNSPLVGANIIIENTDLGTAGDAFRFTLTSAFEGFNTPASFATFNRGIAARIALYQGDMSAASGYLVGSFMDMSNPLSGGPARYYINVCGL